MMIAVASIRPTTTSIPRDGLRNTCLSAIFTRIMLRTVMNDQRRGENKEDNAEHDGVLLYRGAKQFVHQSASA